MYKVNLKNEQQIINFFAKEQKIWIKPTKVGYELLNSHFDIVAIVIGFDRIKYTKCEGNWIKLSVFDFLRCFGTILNEKNSSKKSEKLFENYVGFLEDPFEYFENDKLDNYSYRRVITPKPLLELEE